LWKKAVRNRALTEEEKKHLGFTRMRYLGNDKGNMEFHLKSMALNLKKASLLFAI
jgi:uncharacterized protein YnzC (UPF0291/DUF896 family)